MSLEIVVRPAAALPVLKSGTAAPAPSSQDDEAYIEWGDGPLGTIQRTTTYTSYNYSGSYGSSWPSGSLQNPPPPAQVPQFVFSELERLTHTVRVSDPANAANYVDVEVIDQIAFDSPFGIFIYKFSNPQ